MRLVGVLAVLVLLIHVFWILWVVLGWILTRNRPSLRWFHIGSLLWGILMEVGPASIPAGSDPTSCPNTGSIACLLLQSIGSQQGPTGGKILTKTTFIQRLNTKGGSAPDDTDGCSTTANVGNQRLVPYTADYYFFRKDE
jgi:hypothetical protein